MEQHPEQHYEKTHVPSDHPITQKEGDVVYSNVLRVKADPPDITKDEKKRRVKSLAGAISHNLRRFGEIHVRFMGEPAALKTVKAIAIASGMVAVHGLDLYCRPGFFMAGDIEGDKEMTGMCFLVFASSNNPSPKAD
jgi:stage V sporulation protein SpoVS